MRRWLSWSASRSVRLVLCFFRWHYWRHNTLHSGIMAGDWLRCCNDCQRWEQIDPDKRGMKWKRYPQ